MNAPLRITTPSSWRLIPESLLRFVTDRRHVETRHDAAIEAWTSPHGESIVRIDARGAWALDIDAIGNDEPMMAPTWIEPEARRDESGLLANVAGILARGDREADRREYAEAMARG